MSPLICTYNLTHIGCAKSISYIKAIAKTEKLCLDKKSKNMEKKKFISPIRRMKKITFKKYPKYFFIFRSQCLPHLTPTIFWYIETIHQVYNRHINISGVKCGKIALLWDEKWIFEKNIYDITDLFDLILILIITLCLMVS